MIEEFIDDEPGLDPDKVNESLRELGEKIQRENFALGLPVTYAEGNKVVKVYKDGTKEIIATIEPVVRKHTGNFFVVKK